MRWRLAVGGRRCWLRSIRPAMDVENWQALGINPQFAAQQQARH